MFRLEALYAGETYSEWPQKDEEALPDGVAVRLLLGDGEGMEGKVLVPAGLVIQPTLERGTLLEASGPSGRN